MPSHEGTSLRELLVKHRITQSEFATAMGTSVQIVSKMFKTTRFSRTMADRVLEGLRKLGITYGRPKEPDPAPALPPRRRLRSVPKG